MKTKTVIASMAISLALMGTASAGDLATMDGIPAEAMSHDDMGKVEGKYNVYQFFAAYMIGRQMASKPAPVYSKPVQQSYSNQSNAINFSGVGSYGQQQITAQRQLNGQANGINATINYNYQVSLDPCSYSIYC